MSDFRLPSEQYSHNAIAAMTPAEATAALSKLTVDYEMSQRPAPSDNPAVEASRRLSDLAKSEKFRDRLFEGDAGTVKKFKELSEAVANGSDADFAIASHVPEGHINRGTGPTLEDQISAAQDLQAKGWPAQAVHELLSDKKPTLEQHVDAKRRLANMDYVAKLNEARKTDPLMQRLWGDLCWAAGCYEPAA